MKRGYLALVRLLPFAPTGLRAVPAAALVVPAASKTACQAIFKVSHRSADRRSDGHVPLQAQTASCDGST
jgi:hypothetical protein